MLAKSSNFLERRGDHYQCRKCDQFTVPVGNDKVCENNDCPGDEVPVVLNPNAGADVKIGQGNATQKSMLASNLVKECSICMEDMKKNSNCKFLECFHKFHTACIDDWLQKVK